jgi:ribosome recycling factor
MKAAVRACKEALKTVIKSIWSELEKTINNRTENVRVSVDQQTQGFHEELYKEIKEKQRHLQLVMTSINMHTGSLNDDITDTKKDFHEALHEELARPHVPS